MDNRVLKIIIVAFCCTLSLMSCNDDEDNLTGNIPATKTGTFIDSRDGNEYKWVRYGKLDWMAENFRYDLQDEVNCMLYDGEGITGNLDVNKYGRLYTYKGAQNACPEGWRLPTDEDWKDLEMQMGMSESDANKWDWRGNVALKMMAIYENVTDINIQMAGYYTPHMVMGLSGCRYYGVYGYFWTSTSDNVEGKENGFYIFRKFIYNSGNIFRQSTTDEYGMSVRYVRDAE